MWLTTKTPLSHILTIPPEKKHTILGNNSHFNITPFTYVNSRKTNTHLSTRHNQQGYNKPRYIICLDSVYSSFITTTIIYYFCVHYHQFNIWKPPFIFLFFYILGLCLLFTELLHPLYAILHFSILFLPYIFTTINQIYHIDNDERIVATFPINITMLQNGFQYLLLYLSLYYILRKHVNIMFHFWSRYTHITT